MYDLYIKSINRLSASRVPTSTPTETDAASLAEYEKLLHQLAKTPVPREESRPVPEIESASPEEGR